VALPIIKLTITTTSETYEVRLSPAAQVAWEKRFSKSLSELGSGVSMTELFGMGYEGTRYAGKTVPAKFEDWIEQLVDIDIDAGDTENPTDAAPSAE